MLEEDNISGHLELGLAWKIKDPMGSHRQSTFLPLFKSKTAFSRKHSLNLFLSSSAQFWSVSSSTLMISLEPKVFEDGNCL